MKYKSSKSQDDKTLFLKGLKQRKPFRGVVDPAAFQIKMKGRRRRERTLKKKELKEKCRPQNAMKSEQAYLFLVNCGFAP